jgi:hypothetical protein
VAAFFIVNSLVISDDFRVRSPARYRRPARPFPTFFFVDLLVATFFLDAASFTLCVVFFTPVGAFFLVVVGPALSEAFAFG